MRDKARDEAIAAAFLGGESMAAIARHYGISRERVRQLLVRQDVPMSTRVHRMGFQPLNVEDVRFRYGWSRAGAWWWRTHHKHKATRREHLRKMRSYVAETGDTCPSWPIVLEVTGCGSISRLAQVWGRPQNCGKPYTISVNRFRKLAGLTARPQGWHGHRRHDATA